MPVFKITDYQAAGDGTHDDTRAIQQAVDACHAAGGGTVLVPAGKTFLTGTVTLKSRVNLHLEHGARLISAADPSLFPNDDLRCMIEARGAHDIALTGGGTIDGRAKLFMVADLKYIYEPRRDWRPRLVGLIGCQHVTIRDLTLADAANWCLHLVGCEEVVISGLRILNDLRVPNCDGIDPDHCRNVRISDCHIEAGDDCIVLKTTKDYTQFGPTENITVTGCTLISTSAALKIGTESVQDFRNLVFQGCHIRSSSRGLAIQLRDQGNVENVLFANCTVETRLFEDHWWGKAEPIYITALRRYQQGLEEPPPWNPAGGVGQVRRVRISNILCRGENGAFLVGSPDSPLQDIVLDNITLELDKWTRWPGGRQDRRPCDRIGADFRDPRHDPGLREHPTAGLYIEHAQDLLLRDVRVAWGANRPAYFRHALEAHQVQDLQLVRFRGESAFPDQYPAQLLDQVQLT